MEDDLQIDLDLDQVEQLGSEIFTNNSTTQPEQVQQPSTEGYIPLGEEGFTPRPGALGAAQDIVQSTMVGMPQNLYEGVAPAVGLVDTMTDAFNMATGFNVPKLPEYEDKTSNPDTIQLHKKVEKVGFENLTPKEKIRYYNGVKLMEDLNIEKEGEEFSKTQAGIAAEALSNK